MSVPEQVSRPSAYENCTGAETKGNIDVYEDVVPLIPEAAKRFLDGRIDADRYMQLTRNDASAQAQEEYARETHPRSARKLSSSIFGLSAAAYIVLGLASNSSNTVISVVAFVTATASALLGIRFFLKYREY
jgi:hypothetical protein